MPTTRSRRRSAATSREARLARVAAVAASLVFVTFLTVTTSRAAFSAQTSNVGNSASTGSVSLTDDDAGTALFTLTDMTPGTTYTNCVTVTYSGTTPTQPVKLYRDAAVGGTGLESYLDLTVEIGSGGSFGSCAGFSGSTLSTGTLASFMSTRLDYSSGLSSGWTPSGSPESRTFRFSLSVQNDNNAQGKTATFGFTWEAQS